MGRELVGGKVKGMSCCPKYQLPTYPDQASENLNISRRGLKSSFPTRAMVFSSVPYEHVTVLSLFWCNMKKNRDATWGSYWTVSRKPSKGPIICIHLFLTWLLCDWILIPLSKKTKKTKKQMIVQVIILLYSCTSTLRRDSSYYTVENGPSEKRLRF